MSRHIKAEAEITKENLNTENWEITVTLEIDGYVLDIFVKMDTGTMICEADYCPFKTYSTSNTTGHILSDATIAGIKYYHHLMRIMDVHNRDKKVI